MYKSVQPQYMLLSAHNLFTNSLDGGGKSGAGRLRSYLEPAESSVSESKAGVRRV